MLEDEHGYQIVVSVGDKVCHFVPFVGPLFVFTIT